MPGRTDHEQNVIDVAIETPPVMSDEREALMPAMARRSRAGRVPGCLAPSSVVRPRPRGRIGFDGGHADGWAYGFAAAGLAADRDAPLLVVGNDVPRETAALVGSCPALPVTVVDDEATVSVRSRRR